MSLFEDSDIVNQYIDNSGKTRMLNFSFEGKGISLMVPPSPPLNVQPNKTIYTVSIDRALRFVKNKNLTIDFQDVKEDKVIGLWISYDELSNFYIPVKGNIMENIDISDYSKMRPLLEDEKQSQSALDNFKLNAKIADFLKKYTLYTYSLNPSKFGKKSFVIKENHIYDIEKINNKLFTENNNVFYDDHAKLIVPSKMMRDKLIAYQQVMVLNDKEGILNLKNVSTLDEGYKTMSDFNSFPNQLIFNSKNGIRKWKTDLFRLKNLNSVSLAPLPSAVEPYFYRIAKTNSIVIIQNVENGNIDLAVKISYKWLKDRVNKGYYPFEASEIPSNISYITYTDNTEIKNKGKTDEYALVYFYENGEYAAILKLES